MDAGVDQVVVAVRPAELDDARALLGSTAQVVTGGNDRGASVRAALAAADPSADVVLVHDAARAFVPVGVITAVIAAVRAGAPAVIPVLPVRAMTAAQALRRLAARSAAPGSSSSSTACTAVPKSAPLGRSAIGETASQGSGPSGAGGGGAAAAVGGRSASHSASASTSDSPVLSPEDSSSSRPASGSLPTCGPVCRASCTDEVRAV